MPLFTQQPIELSSMEKNESMLEDSCVLTDPLKSESRSLASCAICSLSEDLLLNKGPLIPMAYGETNYFMCKGCTKQYVAKNIKTELKGYCLRYSVDNLVVPGTKTEFPRNFVIEGKTVDLIAIPKINTTVYIILERTDYDRPLGHVEGLVLKMNDQNILSVGNGDQAAVKINDTGMAPVQSKFHFENTQFYISDSNSQAGTFVKPYNNPVLTDKLSSAYLRMYDLYMTITYKKQTAPTANEFVLSDATFQLPSYTQTDHELPESLAIDASQLSAAQKANRDMVENNGNINRVPQFHTFFNAVSKEVFQPESITNNE